MFREEGRRIRFHVHQELGLEVCGSENRVEVVCGNCNMAVSIDVSSETILIPSRMADKPTMPCSYQIDSESRVVRCRAWGTFTHAEAGATRLKFIADPIFSADLHQLYDFSDVVSFEMTHDQMRDLGRWSSPFKPKARRAAVAPQASIYGVLRMFAIQHEVSGGQTDIQVFRSTREAEIWLGIQA